LRVADHKSRSVTTLNLPFLNTPQLVQIGISDRFD
jgi:hypothetical protein